MILENGNLKLEIGDAKFKVPISKLLINVKIEG